MRWANYVEINMNSHYGYDIQCEVVGEMNNEAIWSNTVLSFAKQPEFYGTNL